MTNIPVSAGGAPPAAAPLLALIPRQNQRKGQAEGNHDQQKNQHGSTSFFCIITGMIPICKQLSTILEKMWNVLQFPGKPDRILNQEYV